MSALARATNQVRQAPRQRGVAVIMAILIVALAAVLSTALIWQQNLWLHQLNNAQNLAQANILAASSTDWAAAVLYADPRNVDDLQEPWAQAIPPVPVAHAEVGGMIQDQQGLFNLNNLVNNGKVDTHQQGKFNHLLQILGLPVTLSNALIDWMDVDNIALPDGGEDGYYMGLRPPYRAANTPLTQVGDLSAVRGFTPEIIAVLRPFVTVLPKATAVNVNTAPAEVLCAMVDGMTLPEAIDMVSKRDNQYFTGLSDFHAALPRIDLVATDNDLSVNSQFFLVTIVSQVGEARSTRKTLLERESVHWPHALWVD